MTDAGGGDAGTTGLRIHAVVRSGWRRGVPEGWRLVEAGPVSAAVRPAGGASGDVGEFARRVDSLMREVPLVPAPPGLVAGDEEAVRRFLRRARLPLLEALELCEGCWALRVHLSRREPPADPMPDLDAFRRALRRRARAVRTLPAGEGRLPSAAFLVPRRRWIAFVEETARREGELAGLEVDVTGPWPPWDFVRLFAEEAP